MAMPGPSSRSRSRSGLLLLAAVMAMTMAAVPFATACCCGKNPGPESETMRHGAGYCGMIHGAAGSNASDICRSKGCTFYPELKPPCAAACHQVNNLYMPLATILSHYTHYNTSLVHCNTHSCAVPGNPLCSMGTL